MIVENSILNMDSVIGASLSSYNDFNNVNQPIKVFVIEVFVNNGNMPIRIEFGNNEERALNFLEKLSDLIDRQREDKKDYIQGFKDGCEYALKLKDK